MDPTEIASTALTILSPYLTQAGEKAVEEVGKTLPGMASKLWQAIVTKFTGQPAAQEAVKDLVQQPADDDNKASFRKELRKAVESDAPFAKQLEELLRQAQQEAGMVIHNTGSGAVATSGGVAAGAGGVAVGGNITGNITIGAPEHRG